MAEQDRLEQQAEEILRQCESVQLVYMDKGGYPRPVEMEVLQADSFGCIWFTTLCSAQKVACYKRNSKAGVSYSHGFDSVSLTGNVTVHEDMVTKERIWRGRHAMRFATRAEGGPQYCILHFTANSATFLLNGEKARRDYMGGKK